MNRVQLAARQIKVAIDQLQLAKANLRAARNDQHIAVALQLAALEEIYDILTDPECTPEITEGGETSADFRKVVAGADQRGKAVDTGGGK